MAKKKVIKRVELTVAEARVLAAHVLFSLSRNDLSGGDFIQELSYIVQHCPSAAGVLDGGFDVLKVRVAPVAEWPWTTVQED